jgi:penicillin-insensitive murein endopeptidase
MICALVLLLVLFRTAVYANPAQQWSAIRSPVPGVSRIIGTYTAGCIQGAVPLPPDGRGFQSVRRHRQRFFGHPSLIRYIEELGSFVASQGWGVLHIGDLGQARGGPTPYGHRSHQTGLDVDIWFWLGPRVAVLPAAQHDAIEPQSMLTADRQALDPARWTPQHAHLLRQAAALALVERIFVHPRIKQALCGQFPGAAWLRRLRPWWGHDEHFHVRLRCPDDQGECRGQEPLPEGTGCEASLEWWFSEEAQTPPRRVDAGEVQLPAACGAILKY